MVFNNRRFFANKPFIYFLNPHKNHSTKAAFKKICIVMVCKRIAHRNALLLKCQVNHA